MSLAVLYICTGDYLKFWPAFHQSAEAHLLPGTAKRYFVFTNGELETTSSVVRIQQDSLGWPFNTLYRFRMFLRIRAQLQSFSHVIYFNANCVVQKSISFEDLFAPGVDLVACLHPGFFDKPPAVHTYERRPQSTACVHAGAVYRAGGIMGGTTQAFLDAASHLVDNIEHDLENGLVALWHDESHWNAYLNQRAPELNLTVHDLSPGYLYPEGWNLPFEARILLREKSNVIDVQRIKGNLSPEPALGEVRQGLLRRLLRRAFRSN